MNLNKIIFILSNRKKRIEVKQNIVNRCGVSPSTVCNWLSGRSKPPSIYHQAISEIIGIEVKELFPEITENTSI